MHDMSSLFDNLVQKDDRALPSAHTLYEAVVNVDHRFCPGETHEFEDFEELSEMKILLRRNDIDHFVEGVFFVSFNCTANITSKINGSSIYKSVDTKENEKRDEGREKT